jgi:hypothetical protein
MLKMSYNPFESQSEINRASKVSHCLCEAHRVGGGVFAERR